MVRIIVEETLHMIYVQEEENFWTGTNWEKAFENYYKPLIESNVLII